LGRRTRENIKADSVSKPWIVTIVMICTQVYLLVPFLPLTSESKVKTSRAQPKSLKVKLFGEN